MPEEKKLLCPLAHPRVLPDCRREECAWWIANPGDCAVTLNVLALLYPKQNIPK